MNDTSDTVPINAVIRNEHIKWIIFIVYIHFFIDFDIAFINLHKLLSLYKISPKQNDILSHCY